MRILVNDIAASSGGALSILKNFYEYIKNNEESRKHEWIFLLSDFYIEETPNIKVIILKESKSWLNKMLFDYFTGKKIISALEPDVVFSLQNTMTYGLKFPHVVYVHQSLPFQNEKNFSFLKKNEAKLAIYQHVIGFIIKNSIKSSQLTIVQTHWMKEAIVKEIKISEENIIVAFPDFKKPRDTVDFSLFNKYSFFYPANDAIYKNHGCIEEAVRILIDQNVTDFEVIRTIDGEPHNKVFVNNGYMEYTDVIRQYEMSTLIFPSYIETIGLPLLEAKQQGAIILASDTHFARETLNNYDNAYYFDPFNPKELADLMLGIMKEKITKKGTKKIKGNAMSHNSWEAVLREIIKRAN